MKHVRCFGILLVALLTIGGMQAAGASAHQWEKNKRPVGKGEVVPVRVEFNNFPFVSEFISTKNREAFRCSFVEKGKLEPGGVQQITEIADKTSGKKAIKCELILTGECNTSSIEAVDLPWKAELATVEGELRNVIVSGTKGSPAWRRECKKHENTFHVECPTFTNTRLKIPTVSPPEEYLEEIFDSKSPLSICDNFTERVEFSGSGKMQDTEFLSTVLGAS